MELIEAPIDDMNKIWVGISRWNMMVKVGPGTVTAILDANENIAEDQIRKQNLNPKENWHRKVVEMKRPPMKMKEDVNALGQRNREEEEEGPIQDQGDAHRVGKGAHVVKVGEDQALENDDGEDHGLVAMNTGTVDDLVTDGMKEVAMDMIIGGMKDKEKWTVWKDENAKKSVRGREVEVEKSPKSEAGRIEMIELTLMSGQPNPRMRKILG